MLSEQEPTRLQQVGQERRVAQICRPHAEVGVGRVLGGGEVGIAGMEIDSLSADKDDGVELFGQRMGGVEQRSAGANVQRVRTARHARSSPSTSAFVHPVTVPDPVRSAGPRRVG